jgi:hypothetical protein
MRHLLSSHGKRFIYPCTTQLAAVNVTTGTTTQIILQDSAQTLTEVVTRSSRLQKYWAINGDNHFYLWRRSHLPAL